MSKIFIQNQFKFKVNAVKQKEIDLDYLKESKYYKPRKWHKEFLKTVKEDSNVSIVSPTGSGKTYLINLLIYLSHQKDNSRQYIISVPKVNIGHGFKETHIDLKGKKINVKVFKKWVVLDSKDTKGVLKTFLSNKKNNLLADKIIIVTHTTLSQFDESLTEQEKRKFYKNVSLYVDESHHLEMWEDQEENEHFNRLGKVVNFFLKNQKKLNTKVVLATATFFRSNGLAFVSDEFRDKFKIFTHSFPKYFEEDCYFLKSFSCDTVFYPNNWEDAIKKLYEKKSFRSSTNIIFIPPSASIHNKFREKDKYEFVQKIKEALKEYNLNIIDLVTESEQKKGLEMVREDNERVKEGKKPTIHLIIAMFMFQEGSDYIPITNIISIGFRKSLTQYIQMVGRGLRDYKGKKGKTVRAVTLISNMYKYYEAITNDNGEMDRLRDAMNQNVGMVFSNMLMEDILMPDVVKVNTLKVSGKLTDEEKKLHKKEEHISIESLTDEIKKEGKTGRNIWFDEFQEESVKVKEEIIKETFDSIQSLDTNKIKINKLKESCKSIVSKYGCKDTKKQNKLYISLRNNFLLKNIMHEGINKFNKVNLLESVDISKFFIDMAGKPLNMKNIIEYKRVQNLNSIPYPEYYEAECFANVACPRKGLDTYEKYQDYIRILRDKAPANINYYAIKEKKFDAKVMEGKRKYQEYLKSQGKK